MLTRYAPLLVLASTALAAPLACGADSPLVTVTTYITGYPPAPSSTSTSTSSSASSTLKEIDYANANALPGAYDPVHAVTSPSAPKQTSTYDPYSSVKAPEAAVPTQPAVPKPVAPSSSSTKDPPPPASTYIAPAPAPPPAQPTYGNSPPSPAKGGSGTKSMTPHDKWSSSVGVVGCKINTNRVAYWPEYPDATRYCVKVSHKGRSVHLLHIDQSGGANDISYDAWNYLATGKSATESPHCGGGIDMEYEWVDNHACDDLILDDSDGEKRLPILASNPDLAIAAPAPKDKYVKLWNFKDLKCETGMDEPCKLPDYDAGLNQAECPSGLGMVSAKTGYVFEDIPYVTSAGCPAP